MHFYDEQRLLLGQTYQAGDKVRLTAPAAAPPRGRSSTCSTPSWSARRTSSRTRRERAAVRRRPDRPRATRPTRSTRPSRSRSAGTCKVYIPPGTYQVNRHIIVDDVTIEGAGSWYTIIKGHEVALDTPAPDGSVHTGVGFYGKYAADGGSTNVHLSGFAIEGDVRERIDTDQVNGIGGALSDSTIDGLYIHHTKVGMWLDGPMTQPDASRTTSSSTRSPTASTSTPA